MACALHVCTQESTYLPFAGRNRVIFRRASGTTAAAAAAAAVPVVVATDLEIHGEHAGPDDAGPDERRRPRLSVSLRVRLLCCEEVSEEAEDG